MLSGCVLILLIGFFSGLFFIALFKKFALRFRAFNSRGMSLAGGASMGLAFIIAAWFGLAMFGRASGQAIGAQVPGVIASSSLMLLFGIFDDRFNLSVAAKIAVQLIAASILIFYGVKTQIVLVGDAANVAITLIWILAITNAMNHLDVMDGLAAGVSLIIGFAFFAFALINRDYSTAILSLSLAAASLACFIYNFPPARIYMGNAGSHFLGFVLAAVAINIGYAPVERKAALLSPLLLLGFPIFDTIFLILSRLSKKLLPFRKSNDHLALRMLSLGYSKRKALVYMLGLNIFFCVCAILVSKASNVLGLAVIAVVTIVSLLIAREMGKVTVDARSGNAELKAK